MTDPLRSSSPPPGPAHPSTPAGAAPVRVEAPDTPPAQRPIERTDPERPFRDVMGGAARMQIGVLDHGFIALVDAMPRLVPEGQTADAAIVQAARVSYGQGTKQVSEDRGLIRYLLRHRHTTPFEMIEFKFHIAMPIFIARQWIRHRTANVNEYSARYSIVRDRFYMPEAENVRKQSRANRQGGEETFAADESATAEAFVQYLRDAEALYERYLSLTQAGVSRELARIGLPVNVYTEWYWKCDLHNILRFLALRLDAHAQMEIRVYAEAMLRLIEPIVPLTVEAFRDYELDSIRLTRAEVEAIRAHRGGVAPDISASNAREAAEWHAKRGTLNLGGASGGA
ncbi:MAG: FAD-dependent thymidylate synthase [Planctomycetota bacterium]|nr:FAD-dependent thymidylate synthase [Planctomycetota bacterium]